ncbi:MAG TPA: aspartyl protease family protein [Chthonomonadaceae bacterium]|nr:aspartyl protease family protein [Chthonomonadaceae bacterium]
MIDWGKGILLPGRRFGALAAVALCNPVGTGAWRAAGPPTPPTPLARLRHAYALDRMETMRRYTEAHAIVRARVEMWLPVHNAFRVVSYYRGERTYERIAIGSFLGERWYDRARKVGWERHGGYVNDLAPTDLLEARQAQAHTFRLLADGEKPGAQAIDRGLRRLPDGTTARRIRFVPPPAPSPAEANAPEAVPTDFYLDPRTDRLRAIGYRDRDPHRGVPAETIMVIASWMPATPARPFSYPGVLRVYQDGRLAQRIQNETVDCQTPLADDRFARPVEADHFSPASRLPTRVPLDFVHGYCVVPVYVNGQRRASRFLLDTGAASTTLSRPLSRRLRLRLGARITNYSGLGNFASRLTRIQSLRVGGAELRSLPVDAVTDNALDSLAAAVGEHLDGILGNDFLRAFQMTLDYGGANGPVLKFQRPDAPAPSGTRVPFFFSGGAPAVIARIPGGADISMTVDTGAPTTWLPPRYVNLLPADRCAVWFGFAGEPAGTRLVWLPEITLPAAPDMKTGAVLPPSASTAAPTVPLVAPSGPLARSKGVTLSGQVAWSVVVPRTSGPTGSLLADEYEGLFGSDLLRYFRITFDFRRGALVFEPLSQPALSRGDAVGLGIWPDFKPLQMGRRTLRRVFVEKLWPFSPAARAGVRVGDELMEVEDRPIYSLTESELAEYLWGGQEGRSVRLRIRRRGDVRRIVEVEYRRLF